MQYQCSSNGTGMEGATGVVDAVIFHQGCLLAKRGKKQDKMRHITTRIRTHKKREKKKQNNEHIVDVAILKRAYVLSVLSTCAATTAVIHVHSVS